MNQHGFRRIRRFLLIPLIFIPLNILGAHLVDERVLLWALDLRCFRPSSLILIWLDVVDAELSALRLLFI